MDGAVLPGFKAGGPFQDRLRVVNDWAWSPNPSRTQVEGFFDGFLELRQRCR